MKDYDDKDLVIVAVLLICVGAMAIPGVSDTAYALIENALCGLFGVAIGRKST